jgi:hypothetical protein
MKMAGSAINRTIKQTKAAISICSPSVWPRIEAFGRRGFLTFDTRASGPKFNRGAGSTTGVFFTLKVRSPVCRGPMRSSSPRRCRLTCVPATTPRRSSATAPAMCLPASTTRRGSLGGCVRRPSNVRIARSSSNPAGKLAYRSRRCTPRALAATGRAGRSAGSRARWAGLTPPRTPLSRHSAPGSIAA